MMKGCWATGRMFHQFDQTTHRCKCGRWQAGFAPKKVSVRPRAECQICEREQALTTDGKMVHHGYERPGHGWIIGDCFGVGHKPYTATSALYAYLVFLQDRLFNQQLDLNALADGRVASFMFRYRANPNDWRDKTETSVEVKQGDAAKPTGAPCWVTVPSYESLRATHAMQVARDNEMLAAEIARVNARILRAEEPSNG